MDQTGQDCLLMFSQTPYSTWPATDVVDVVVVVVAHDGLLWTQSGHRDFYMLYSKAFYSDMLLRASLNNNKYNINFTKMGIMTCKSFEYLINISKFVLFNYSSSFQIHIINIY